MPARGEPRAAAPPPRQGEKHESAIMSGVAVPLKVAGLAADRKSASRSSQHTPAKGSFRPPAFLSTLVRANAAEQATEEQAPASAFRRSLTQRTSSPPAASTVRSRSVAGGDRVRTSSPPPAMKTVRVPVRTTSPGRRDAGKKRDDKEIVPPLKMPTGAATPRAAGRPLTARGTGKVRTTSPGPPPPRVFSTAIYNPTHKSKYRTTSPRRGSVSAGSGQPKVGVPLSLFTPRGAREASGSATSVPSRPQSAAQRRSVTAAPEPAPGSAPRGGAYGTAGQIFTPRTGAKTPRGTPLANQKASGKRHGSPARGNTSPRGSKLAMCEMSDLLKEADKQRLMADTVCPLTLHAAVQEAKDEAPAPPGLAPAHPASSPVTVGAGMSPFPDDNIAPHRDLSFAGRAVSPSRRRSPVHTFVPQNYHHGAHPKPTELNALADPGVTSPVQPSEPQQHPAPSPVCQGGVSPFYMNGASEGWEVERMTPQARPPQPGRGVHPAQSPVTPSGVSPLISKGAAVSGRRQLPPHASPLTFDSPAAGAARTPTTEHRQWCGQSPASARQPRLAVPHPAASPVTADGVSPLFPSRAQQTRLPPYASTTPGPPVPTGEERTPMEVREARGRSNSRPAAFTVGRILDFFPEGQESPAAPEDAPVRNASA
eukprot:TRINITY_DN15394_c0_g1_i1.p1 TRINITY_DN15394_c0_g1~~TRINITY_DN15394_c0_g1_i1.p1  ORF type:complete len:652 (+),score=164.47 TRINITY_DN15394_c0_g1_i1:98-2053(+)